MKFFVCEHCGNFVGMIKDAGVPMMCCGQKMTELIPGTSDGAAEKHVPEFKVDGNKVTVNVGSVDHPMTEEHFIEWIALETKKGAQRKVLSPSDKPCVEFALTDDDAVVAVYAYCNLHGLWKAQ
ncbi:MAG: desulfoferrodoxin [Eubacterium sp.]|nr:desulfoferrodoxin [Eubacterium sp.]